MLVPRTVIDPATPGIRTAPIEDRPILRLLFAATRHTETANPTPTAIVAALRTAARQSRTPRLPACLGRAVERPEDAALVPLDAAGVTSQLERFPALRVGHAVRAVLLVRGQAGKRK
ncbi:hypothetical protein GCM10009647_066810 [Streptomyces sanglieri]